MIILYCGHTILICRISRVDFFLFFCQNSERRKSDIISASCIFKKLVSKSTLHTVCFISNPNASWRINRQSVCFAFILKLQNSLVSGVTTRHHPWRGRSRTKYARSTPSRSSCFQCSHQLSQGKVIKRHLYFFFLLINLSWPPVEDIHHVDLDKVIFKIVAKKTKEIKIQI